MRDRLRNGGRWREEKKKRKGFANDTTVFRAEQGNQLCCPRDQAMRDSQLDREAMTHRPRGVVQP